MSINTILPGKSGLAAPDKETLVAGSREMVAEGLLENARQKKKNQVIKPSINSNY